MNRRAQGGGDPEPVDVDLSLAIQCVELSQLSYRDPEEARALALGRFGYESFEHVSVRGGRDQLIVVEDDATRLLAVRGTDEVRDWLTNFKFWFEKTPMGRVHRGYHDACVAFLPKVRSLAAEQSTKPLVLTGHSMGGAVATLLAATLAAEEGGRRVAGLYTFGQPQVGFGGFGDHLLAHCRFPYFRFVHGADAFAAWTLGGHGVSGVPCYFDLRGRISFGQRLTHIPRVGLKFHRLEYYRYFLRLNRLRLRALEETDEVTVVQQR
jgi:hypothetical protein